MKKNKYEIDMCNGTIMDKLISFSIPLMLSGILQLMFNAVDIVVVGRFSGSQALAAVGSTTALINVFTNLFIGISLGANVLAARYYAAGKTKEMSETLHLKTKETIEGLSDEQVLDLLRLKWIAPLCASLRAMPEAIIAGLEKEVQTLADKYAVTYLELEEQIQKSEAAIAGMIDELTGSEYDMKGLSEFQSLLKGE